MDHFKNYSVKTYSDCTLQKIIKINTRFSDRQHHCIFFKPGLPTIFGNSQGDQLCPLVTCNRPVLCKYKAKFILKNFYVKKVNQSMWHSTPSSHLLLPIICRLDVSQ